VNGFARPLLLPLVVLAPLALAWLTLLRRRNQRIPGLAVRRRRGHGIDISCTLALAGLAVAWFAAAGPRTAALRNPRTTGRDLVILLDLSASMGAPSGQGTALAAARSAVQRLAELRRTDRLALVAFGGKAVVLTPLTLDHTTLVSMIGGLTPATLGSETAIGDAIAVGLDLLRGTPRGSGGIVLVSDGESNAGAVDPTTAAEVAKERGVRVSTVAVGAEGDASGPTRVNEPLMRAIARATGGDFVRAHDEEALTRAFERLAHLEPAVLPAPASWIWSDRSARPARLVSVLLLAAALGEAASRRVWA
jgi:Ca-activated chloride channel family protein